MDNRYVFRFDDPRAVAVAVAGGKGASLARLTQGGFDVPPGVVVSAAVYRAFIAGVPELPDRVGALDHGDAERLHRQCREIREHLLAEPLPAALREELARGLAVVVSDAPVSVRSSATLEDLAGAAFAGQHDTYLNVTGIDAVLDRLLRCWASLWEDRAVRYRHERGFGQLDAEMAVVVQRMVASDVAGVAFSLDPITGALDRVFVNAAWGLGEIVVSGEGGVDQFVVEKSTGSVIDRHIAEKAERIIATAAGTAREPVPPAQRTEPSLADARLARLSALVRRIERFYGFPQDVEWAFAGDALFLLQSRPVTNFPERWTRDESAERFPTPLTPLSWDFTAAGFHESLAHSLALLGLPPFDGRWFARFDGYVYGNQTAIELFTAGYHAQFDTLDELAALVPALRERYRWVQELPVLWARDLDRYLLRLGRLAAVDLRGRSEREVWRHVLAVDALGREYFRPNIAISITQGLLHRTLFRLATLLVGPERAPGLYDRLTSFCETKTNLVNADLHRLYALARRDAAFARLLVDTDRRRLFESGAIADQPEFAAAFGRFLEDHGHREVDFDPYHPTWIGQPWVVLENIRLMLLQGAVPEPTAREHELRVRQQEAEREFLTLVPQEVRNFVGELLRLTRAYTALDDLEHYQTTRLSIPFRAGLVELGRRLADRGALDEPEDIFFLRRHTLAAVVEDGMDPAAALREARLGRSDYERQCATVPPRVHGETAPEPTAAGALRGLAGSPGNAQGPVCRVKGVEDFARFRPGSVLVARTTNPAWTPLFYSACAVVTESGGPLSHGAVTAREVGIPAVMAVHDALRHLEDDELVRVDGTQGLVSRVHA